MAALRMMVYFAVFLAVLGNISCQYGTGTSSGSYAVTASSPSYRVVSIVSPTSNFLRTNPDGSFTGFIWDLLNALKAATGFNFTLSIQPGGVYGGPDAKGEWDGMVGQLIHNTTDIILADFSISSQRLSVIDFTVPYMPFHLVIVSQPNVSLTGIKYAIKASSGTVTYLRGSREPRAREIWANVQANLPTSMVQEAEDGLALARQGGWAFLYPDVGVAVAIKNSDGRLVINRPVLHTNYYALGVQIGSPLQKPLSIAVTKIMATGQIQKLLSMWDLAV